MSPLLGERKKKKIAVCHSFLLSSWLMNGEKRHKGNVLWYTWKRKFMETVTLEIVTCRKGYNGRRCVCTLSPVVHFQKKNRNYVLFTLWSSKPMTFFVELPSLAFSYLDLLSKQAHRLFEMKQICFPREYGLQYTISVSEKNNQRFWASQKLLMSGVWVS